MIRADTSLTKYQPFWFIFHGCTVNMLCAHVLLGEQDMLFSGVK